MRMTGLLVFAMAAGLLCCEAAKAVQLDVDAEVDAKVTSAYVWRGQIINDEACFQPDIVIRGSNAMFMLWGTWNLTDAPGASTQTRMDATLDYRVNLGDSLLVRPGLIAYVYHDDLAGKAKDTFEVFVKSMLDVPLLPSVEVYYDFSQIEGFYGVFQVMQSFDVGTFLGLDQDTVALDIRATVSGADEAYLKARFTVPADTDAGTDEFVPAKEGLVDATATVSLPTTVRENVVITPAAKYMRLLDSDIREALEKAGRDTDHFVYSITLGVSF